MRELILKDYKSKSDITYKQYEQMEKLLPDTDDESEIDTNFMTVRMLKIFYNINPKDVKLLKATQVSMLIKKITDILNQPPSELKRVIEYKGKLYGLIPNLLECTYGELVDLDKRYEAKDIISLTSIIYRPIVGEVNSRGEYKIEPYNEYNDVFKDITLDIVQGYIGFFVLSLHLLKIHTRTSTVVPMM